MSCFHPLQISTPDGYKLVPCGKCVGCLMDYRQSWIVRLENEFVSNGYNGMFYTLTYNDDSVPYQVNESSGECQLVLHKPDIDKFLKHIHNKVDYYRKTVDQDYRYSYFLVGEYGSVTFRPHYHMLTFCRSPDDLLFLDSVINDYWSVTHGFVSSDITIPERIQYVCKYTLKQLVSECEERGLPPPFARMSKGIGKEFIFSAYAKDFYSRGYRPYVLDINGFPSRMPRYYNRLLDYDKHNEAKLRNIDLLFKQNALYLSDQDKIRGIPRRMYLSEDSFKAQEFVLERKIKDMMSKDIL